MTAIPTTTIGGGGAASSSWCRVDLASLNIPDMVSFGLLLFAILIEPRDVPMFPQIHLDFTKWQNILCQPVLDQIIMECIRKRLDPELEWTEIRGRLQPLHLFGHQWLMTIRRRQRELVSIERTYPSPALPPLSSPLSDMGTYI